MVDSVEPVSPKTVHDEAEARTETTETRARNCRSDSGGRNLNKNKHDRKKMRRELLEEAKKLAFGVSPKSRARSLDGGLERSPERASRSLPLLPTIKDDVANDDGLPIISTASSSSSEEQFPINSRWWTYSVETECVNWESQLQKDLNALSSESVSNAPDYTLSSCAQIKKEKRPHKSTKLMVRERAEMTLGVTRENTKYKQKQGTAKNGPWHSKYKTNKPKDSPGRKRRTMRLPRLLDPLKLRLYGEPLA
jgi:hypothetical protein